jgi:hypothetical protein
MCLVVGRGIGGAPLLPVSAALPAPPVGTTAGGAPSPSGAAVVAAAVAAAAAPAASIASKGAWSRICRATIRNPSTAAPPPPPPPA